MEANRSPSVAPKRPANIDLRRLVGSVNQLRFNDNRGEVSFFGQKMIILRRDVIRVIREGLEKLVGEQATPFLSYLASGIGVHEGSIFRESTGSMDKSGMNNIVTSALEDTNLGLGKIRIVNSDFDQGTANVIISNCFEAMENGSAEAPNCTFTSGFLAGMFAEVFDKTVQAIETKCMSQGQSECEFQISPLQDSGQDTAQAEGSVEEITPIQSQPNSNERDTPKTENITKTKDGPDEQESLDRAKEKGPSPITPSPASEKADKPNVEADTDEASSKITKRKNGFWNRFQKKG